MDGLLVDSEPWWRVAETIVLGNLSKAPEEADFERMMGNRIQEVIRQWYERYPWKNPDFDDVQQAIVSEVQRLVITNAQLMPGVIEIIEWLSAKKIPMALASSSPMQLINGLMKHYGIFNVFQVICSAEHEEQGKPHPAVFLTTSRKLALLPEELLVFEDSFNGVIAAKAARMKCVAIPAKEHYNQTRFTAADLVLPSLSVFASSHWDRLQ